MVSDVQLLQDWALSLLDLNLVKYGWVHLKRLYHQYYPHLADDMILPNIIKAPIERALTNCSELIPHYHFKVMVETITLSIEAVVEAVGL